MSLKIHVNTSAAQAIGIDVTGTLERDDVIICIIASQVFNGVGYSSGNTWRETENGQGDAFPNSYNVRMLLTLPRYSESRGAYSDGSIESVGLRSVAGFWPPLSPMPNNYFLFANVMYPQSGKIGGTWSKQIYSFKNRDLQPYDYIISDGGFYLFDLVTGGFLMMDNRKLRLINKTRFEMLDFVLKTYQTQ